MSGPISSVRSILVKALETIGEHPEILRILARSLAQVVRESLVETLGTLESSLEVLEVGDTVDEALVGWLEETCALTLVPIHRSAWKVGSATFGCTQICELRCHLDGKVRNDALAHGSDHSEFIAFCYPALVW